MVSWAPPSGPFDALMVRAVNAYDSFDERQTQKPCPVEFRLFTRRSKICERTSDSKPGPSSSRRAKAESSGATLREIVTELLTAGKCFSSLWKRLAIMRWRRAASAETFKPTRRCANSTRSPFLQT